MKYTKYVLFLFMLIFFFGSTGVLSAKSIGAVDLKSLPETIGLEHSDRMNRLIKLSKIYGIAPPQLDEIQVEPGQISGVNYPIPVVRVLFAEGVFFDFNRDTLKNDGQKVLNVMAKSLKHDVPDVKLLVLGHTDSIGSDEYDIDLSKRRATNIIKGLIARGVSPETAEAVAIGKGQPIATNATPEGRTRNRRVEFMVSASQEANLSLVNRRGVIADFFVKNQNSVVSPSLPAKIFGLKKNENGQISQTNGGEVQLQKPEHLQEFIFNKPTEYTPNKLNYEFYIE